MSASNFEEVIIAHARRAPRDTLIRKLYVQRFRRTCKNHPIGKLFRCPILQRRSYRELLCKLSSGSFFKLKLSSIISFAKLILRTSCVRTMLFQSLLLGGALYRGLVILINCRPVLQQRIKMKLYNALFNFQIKYCL